MARKICQTLFGLFVVYAILVGLFALIHYKGVERPDVVSVTGEFHVWVGSFFHAEPEPALPPGTLPAPTAPPSPAPLPTPTAPPRDPAEVKAEEERAAALRLVGEELIPEAEKKYNALGDEGPGFRDRQTEVLALLVRVRNILNPMLDRNPGDRDANRLWDKFTALQRAASKK